MIKKQEEKSQKHEDNEKKITKVSDSAALVLKHPQHYKKKHDTSPTEKHTLSSTKRARHTVNTTTTTITFIQHTQAS
jgi:hypothetical protein